VVVIGVNFEDSIGAARGYIRAQDVTYPIVEDSGSRTALAYGLRGVPETFVVSQSGRIVGHVIGPVTVAALSSVINTTLAGA
jgi:cytochrome c biogenesis protein CcmG, thiol:disulfide interchange protein DsbE